MNKLLSLSALTVTFSLIIVSPVQAYFEPGTGALILQILAGGVAGGVMVLKLYWQSFKSKFGRLLGREPAGVIDPDTASEQTPVDKYAER